MSLLDDYEVLAGTMREMRHPSVNGARHGVLADFLEEAGCARLALYHRCIYKLFVAHGMKHFWSWQWVPLAQAGSEHEFLIQPWGGFFQIKRLYADGDSRFGPRGVLLLDLYPEDPAAGPLWEQPWWYRHHPDQWAKLTPVLAPWMTVEMDRVAGWLVRSRAKGRPSPPLHGEGRKKGSDERS